MANKLFSNFQDGDYWVNIFVPKVKNNEYHWYVHFIKKGSVKRKTFITESGGLVNIEALRELDAKITAYLEELNEQKDKVQEC